MKKALIALLGALPLAGCVGDYYGGYGGYGGPAGPVAYDGYYDDYYGPIYDGYWDNGGVFYYRTGERGHYRADRAGHFRRDPGQGSGRGGRPFHPMHGTTTPPQGRGDGHHRH